MLRGKRIRRILPTINNNKEKENKMDFIELGFESEEEMAQYMEDEMEYHLSVYNQINK